MERTNPSGLWQAKINAFDLFSPAYSGLACEPKRGIFVAVGLALASPEYSSAVPDRSCRRAYGFVGGRQSKFELWGWGQDPCVSSFDEESDGVR